MSVSTNNFTTGPATLADVGNFYYNGCTFSPLFETTVSGTAVKDNAQRTVKYMEYVITADGYVTLPFPDLSTTNVMDKMRKMLTAQGGNFTYQGRGCDIQVNASGTRDVSWGPIPELLEFQPLGGGASAKVRWQVKFRIPEVTTKQTTQQSPITGGNTGGTIGVTRGVTTAGLASVSLLQFNYETVVSYGEDGYSSMSIRGTMEIPLTRATQTTRTLTSTVDDVRSIIDARLLAGIDLNLFRVTRREISVSRDKRTMEFDFEVEEKTYMDLPPGSTMARGSFNVRPAKIGAGLCNWMCTLRATYTVRADFPRRWAWFAFLYLLRLRMAYSNLAPDPNADQNPKPKAKKLPLFGPLAGAAGLAGLFGPWNIPLTSKEKESRRAWLMDFSIDEGLYLDSRTVSFSASWKLVTTFSHILLASGMWRKLPETNAQGTNLWAIYMKDIQGSQSWMPNKLDPRLDVIVDFGGG